MITGEELERLAEEALSNGEAPIVGVNPPLRFKRQSDGVIRVQGVYAMKDEVGFPISESYDYCEGKGMVVDWVEALADAGRQCIFKYDALIEEMKILVPDVVKDAEMIFNMGYFSMEGDTFGERANNLYNQMWSLYIYILNMTLLPAEKHSKVFLPLLMGDSRW